jgi:PAS domain S-box-containing protein
MIPGTESRATAKILITEDAMIVAEDLAVTIQDLGYQVVGIASTGEEAIQIAEKELPGLILMDINLAGDMDGIETSEHIRSRFDIPVVFVTAYDEQDVLRRAKLTQPYGYMIKPFSNHILKITLETALYKHEADKRLKESEAQYRTILGTVMDGFLLFEMNGRILEANDAYCAISGYSHQELLGMSIAELEAIHSPEEVSERILRIVVEGSARFETVLCRKDGSLMQSEVSIQFLSGTRKSFFAFVRDITERKNAEQEMERLVNQRREAEAQVKKLSGMLPICASCKKIRDDNGYWTQIEAYIRDHSEAEFTHSFCPECFQRLYPKSHKEEPI